MFERVKIGPWCTTEMALEGVAYDRCEKAVKICKALPVICSGRHEPKALVSLVCVSMHCVIMLGVVAAVASLTMNTRDKLLNEHHKYPDMVDEQTGGSEWGWGKWCVD